jgi:hypothetical protein
MRLFPSSGFSSISSQTQYQCCGLSKIILTHRSIVWFRRVSGSSHPFRHTNPGSREVKKLDTRDLSLFATFASLYVVANVVQMISIGNPTVYGPIQLRIADCLIALSALLGWPVVAGVTVGCFLTNSYYFLGPVDVVFGPIANLIAASIILLLRKRRLLACIVCALPIGIIVGGYLWTFFPPPDILGVLPAWAAMIVSITISSLVAIAGVGYSLLTILSRPSVIEPLKSRGLKVLV